MFWTTRIASLSFMLLGCHYANSVNDVRFVRHSAAHPAVEMYSRIVLYCKPDILEHLAGTHLDY